MSLKLILIFWERYVTKKSIVNCPPRLNQVIIAHTPFKSCISMLERPNPDELLAKYEIKPKHGKLTLFLGAAAGVGKTYTMLKSLRDLIDDKVDVVIAYVESHGRAETQAAIPAEVEQIPLKSINYNGHQLRELDIDAILARKPQLVIIDELAHSNVSGSRNNKRYQDVLEILTAGIDVYSALNIQHIESLNDVVGQITEVKISETVPDFILQIADEVKLIDVTPDELIERLRDGKIYSKERATTALENFFRKGNLIALREMALLKTAHKVEQQVVKYRSEKDIEAVWASHENLMTLIEPGYSSEKIIRSGKAMFDRGFKNWFVVYIESQRLAGKPLAEREKLLSLLELARKLGAKIIALNGDNPSEVLLNFARENNINTLMLSQYRISLYYRLFGSSLVDKISELAPEINLQLINDEFTPAKTKLTFELESKRTFNWHKIMKGSLINLAIFFSLGFALLPLSRFIANENIIMVYFLFIILTNRHRGLVSATIAALVATISFDFFFIAPRFSFAVSDLQYLLTFAIMAGVGTLFNLVNGNLRYQAQKQRKLHQQIRQLYEFSRKLSEALVYQQVFDALDEFFPQLFKAKYALLTPSLAEELAVNHNQLGERLDLTIARWVFDKGQPAGLNTNTFAASQVYYVALNSQLRTRGVLALIPEAPLDFFLPSEQELLNNFIANIATTLERIHFTQIAIQTEVLLAKKID